MQRISLNKTAGGIPRKDNQVCHMFHSLMVTQIISNYPLLVGTSKMLSFKEVYPSFSSFLKNYREVLF